MQKVAPTTLVELTRFSSSSSVTTPRNPLPLPRRLPSPRRPPLPCRRPAAALSSASSPALSPAAPSSHAETSLVAPCYRRPTAVIPLPRISCGGAGAGRPVVSGEAGGGSQQSRQLQFIVGAHLNNGIQCGFLPCVQPRGIHAGTQYPRSELCTGQHNP